MGEKSVFKNVVLSIIKVSLSIIFPLITFPYASRVLLADNLGKVNYALSIEGYFSLIAALGVSGYSIREGARVRDDKEKIERFANEIFTVNTITTIIAYALLLLLMLLPKFNGYRGLILLQSISIILTTLGVDWVNSVFEDYIYITIRSFLIQVVLLGLMFAIVRCPEDYYKYAFLTVLSNGISCALNFFYSRRKYCKISLVKNCNFAKHIKGLIVFFANNIAVSIYLNADTTMLGWYTNDYTVGIYAVAVKVYGVVKTVIAAMFTACIPRLSAYYGNNKLEEYKQLLNSIVGACTLSLFPAVAGLYVLSSQVVQLIAGENFIQAAISLRIICIGIIPAIYGGIITNCVNLPLKREKDNLYATILAALVNIGLNCILIPIYSEKAAAATTVVAEFVVLIFCIIANKNLHDLINIKLWLKNIATSIIEVVLIIVLSIIISRYVSNWIINMCILVVGSIIAYIFLLVLSKNELFCNLLKSKMRISNNE